MQIVLSVDRKYWDKYTVPLLKSLKNTSIKRAHVVCCNFADITIPELPLDIEVSFIKTGTTHQDYSTPRYLKALELVERDDIAVADADSIFFSDIKLPEKPVGLCIRTDHLATREAMKIAAGLATFRKGERKFLARMKTELAKIKDYSADQLALYRTWQKYPEMVEDIHGQMSWSDKAPMYTAKGPRKRNPFYTGMLDVQA